MKNKQNVETKKIIHFLIIILMLLALVFGLVFSSIETSKGIKLGSQYRGSYQAVVGVYDVNKKSNADEQDKNLPNGDAQKAADVLQNKLSPFADGSINVTIDGVSRLIVTAPRDSYNNNQQLFVNAVQSTGGLFIFNDQTNTDVMLDETLMGKAELGTSLENKAPTSDLLGQVEQVSMATGITNRPFLKFDLKQPFVKLNAGGENQNQPTLKMVVDTATLLDTFRNYFLFANDDDTRDEYLNVFLDEVIKPLQNRIRGNAGQGEPTIDSKTNERIILEDFFRVNYWKRSDSGIWSNPKLSLVDINNDATKDLNLEKLKAILFPDSNPDHEFKYSTPASQYVYDSNAKGEDFTTPEGAYYAPLKINGTDVKINEAFNGLTKHLFPILLNKDQQNVDNPFGIDDHFNQNLFADFFIFNGQIPTGGGNQFPEPNRGMIKEADRAFYIGTKNYTIAKTVAAQIAQTTSGFTFHVLSVSTVEAIISQAMFILSIVALLIVALAIAIFILFFYRLLGLFTIIIAAIIGSMTLLMNVVFGIVVGPEIIAIMFVLIGLVMDISVVMFEAFKNNIYLEKRPLLASFNISNRETLGLVIDVLLASLLPNIVLFWIGIGFLKNFATILTMGILFTFIFGIVVLRLMVYFTARTNIWKKYPWMLPIDTSLDYDGRFIYHYLILSKQAKLDNYTTQSQLTAQELIKIKKLEDQIGVLKEKDKKYVKKKTAQKTQKQVRLEQKWTRQWEKLIQKRKKIKVKGNISSFWVTHYDKKIAYLDYLIQSTKKTSDGESVSMVNDQLTRTEKNTTKTGIITFCFTIFVTILALIFTFTIGLNYSVNYGKGTQYYIYGREVANTYNNMMAAPEGINWTEDWEKDLSEAQRQEVYNELKTFREESRLTVLQDHQVSSNAPDEVKNQYENEWQALGVYEAYRYLISNNYLQYLDSRVAKISFKNPIYMYGADYSRIDTNNNAFIDEPWISITTTNDLIPYNNAIKNAMQKFAGRATGNRPSAPRNDGGVLGMTLEPHTANRQIKQIGITFGIVLLALLVYMIIRFKWTYYVALALGLVITLALTVSLIVVLRIPFAIEALAGILGVLGFALITGMLFLGRGKSIIVSKDEKLLNDYFNQEIKLQAQKKHLKADRRQKLSMLKKTHRQALKELDKKDKNYKKTKHQLVKAQSKELKKMKASESLILKQQFKEINHQISLESQKNNFLKEIFTTVLKFGILRTTFLSSFYLVIGIITAVCLPSIGIMGFTLVIGVIASTLVMITIVLPIWIQLERRRIRMRYGYKKFVNTLKVTNEEQIITGLND